MKLKFLFGLTLIAVALNASVVQAQTAIRDLQRDNSSITIAGVVRSIAGNEFILDDGTGQLIVDAGPRWHREVNLLEGEQVTVVGEYDDYDFDAYRITRENGEVITIRNGSVPPWAGERN